MISSYISGYLLTEHKITWSTKKAGYTGVYELVSKCQGQGIKRLFKGYNLFTRRNYYATSYKLLLTCSCVLVRSEQCGTGLRVHKVHKFTRCLWCGGQPVLVYRKPSHLLQFTCSVELSSEEECDKRRYHKMLKPGTKKSNHSFAAPVVPFFAEE